MKPDKEVKICDICNEYYPVILENPDYKLIYLGKPLDICNNCYDNLTKFLSMQRKKILRKE